MVDLPVSLSARPKTYKKGPDVMSKSEQTQSCYRKTWKNQSKLTGFGFVPRPVTEHGKLKHPFPADERDCSHIPVPQESSVVNSRPDEAVITLSSDEDHSSNFSTSPSLENCDSHVNSTVLKRKRDSPSDADVVEPSPAHSVLGPLCKETESSMVSSAASEPDLDTHTGTPEIEADDELDADREDWEEELDSGFVGGGIRDWKALRDQIKEDLKKRKSELSLSQINQLIILSGFATLRLKGTPRMAASVEVARQWYTGDGSGAWCARRVHSLARHYQLFEQLPSEKRGGQKNAQSFLYDKSVQTRCRAWLSSQPTGQVIPRAFRQAVESVIFPELGIVPRCPISERTARRWLIKLGWRHTVIRKGVYMDGHEREDVVKYQNEVYLPKMQEFDRRTVHFKGPELTRIEPHINNMWIVECRLKVYWHDECCFHAFDAASNAWYGIHMMS